MTRRSYPPASLYAVRDVEECTLLISPRRQFDVVVASHHVHFDLPFTWIDKDPLVNLELQTPCQLHFSERHGYVLFVRLFRTAREANTSHESFCPRRSVQKREGEGNLHEPPMVSCVSVSTHDGSIHTRDVSRSLKP